MDEMRKLRDDWAEIRALMLWLLQIRISKGS